MRHRTATRRRGSGCARPRTRVNDPYVPAVFTLWPDLRVHRAYDGYWFWGRPTPRSSPRPARDHRARCAPTGTRRRRELGLARDRRRAPSGRDARPRSWRTMRARRPACSSRGGGARSRSRDALRADPRIVDPDRPAGWFARAAAARGPSSRSTTSRSSRRGATCCAEPRGDAVSTLLRDASHFEGAITLARGRGGGRACATTRSRACSRRACCVSDAGMLGRVPRRSGPTIERYGSANPWPWDRFG